MPWTTSDRVMKVRAKHHVIDVIVEMLDGWRRHLSGRNASLLSFFSFLSIFPLLLAATTILGFVLEGNVELQNEIEDGAFAEIPVLGSQLQANSSSLDGNVWALLIGVGGALWASTKAFVGLQGALDDVWEVPVDDRAGLPVLRGKALAGIAIIGASLVVSVIMSGIVNGAGLPAGRVTLLLVAHLVVEIIVLAAMYRYLTAAKLTWRMVWPGAIAAGIAFAVIQNFSIALVTRITENASDTYGSFALVLGIVTWLGLLSIATLMCAELNAAIVRVDRTAQPERRVVIEEADSNVR